MNLIKVGSTYLNLDQVTEIHISGGDVEIFFVAGDKATVLRGSDAERFRLWLDRTAEALNTSSE